MHTLDADYGGVDGYLRDVGKLSTARRDRLREILLS